MIPGTGGDIVRPVRRAPLPQGQLEAAGPSMAVPVDAGIFLGQPRALMEMCEPGPGSYPRAMVLPCALFLDDRLD